MYLVCGEALFDFFQTDRPEGVNAVYDARIGGSPYNVAMGLARLKARASLFTGVSHDLFGDRIVEAIEKEGIDNWAVVRKEEAPTTLSFVGLDAQGSPAYAFFGNGAADRSLAPEDLPLLPPDVAWLHFGSYSLVTPPTSSTLFSLLEREKSRFISLDPNIRPTVVSDMSIWEARLSAMLPLVDLVKVSTEDLTMLYPDRDPLDTAHSWLEDGPRLVVVTDGGSEVIGLTENGVHRVAVPDTEIVDTVGAGDTFMAMLMYLLGKDGNPSRTVDSLNKDQFSSILDICARAASLTCTRRGADLPRYDDVRAFLKD
ncbi:carbohydrate kinase [Hoeflea sp. WL0058]|uniref:Carbohydrate kinase n=1 Tax=Flavimaribacter sediminis TaxID=2865987 RepID=A0AAE2ZLH2_9HYPH|nr:carbohydrate kinase [Flavimaribacter sediminis]MBW8637051.1 carbohydrate kinase [Flavimaribacter sediminis]